MKRVLFLILSISLSINTFSQKKYNFKTEHIKGQEIVCPARFVDEPSFVDMPVYVKERLNNKKARTSETQGATFIVNYVNFPIDAKSAFQRAVDIWATMLNSEVPIRVTAIWEELESSVLGSASANDFLRNFPGAKQVNTYYPLALAEKLAGRDLNSVNEDDIYCRFNSKIKWFFAPDEDIPAGTFDLTSTVLHELGHGLGFVSSTGVSGTQGYYGFGTPFKDPFDMFIVTGDNKTIVDTTQFKNPSVELKTAFESKNIFFVSPSTNYSNTDDKVKLYAPRPWEPGSSISHLDDKKYPAGSINSLMTPSAAQREKNLNPGPVMMDMMKDMGWKSTSIVHTPLKNIAAPKMVRFEAKILSDTTLVPNSVKLVYILNQASNDKAQEVLLTKDSKTGNYFANVNLPVGTTAVEYYIEAKDNFKDVITSPGNGGLSSTNYIYSFEVGAKDVAGPVLDHYAPDVLPSTSPVSIIANIDDDFQDGIDTAYVSYTINGNAMPAFGLKKYKFGVDNVVFSQGRGDDYAYLAENAIKNLKDGDKVKYQIIAIDKAKNKTVLPTTYSGTNQNDKPTEAFYEFTVTTIKGTSVKDYSNDFEGNADDFATIGFSISTPDGFSGKSLNSSHPYTNGLGLLDPADQTNNTVYLPFDKNEIAMLRVPIELKGTDATINFDEVVLVEPGESGSLFGDNDFYDYVVVEGSLDGANWFPLEDGYDSRDIAVWRNTFNNNFSTGTAPNSTGRGTPAMIKKRTVNIYGSDFTAAEYTGQKLLIRFRLFADQWTGGWGWSIDNLYIQKSAPVVLANENPAVKGLSIYPNPTQEYLNIDLDVRESQTVKLEVYSLKGNKMIDALIPVEGEKLDYQINIGQFSSGTYMVKVTEKRGVVVKKFIKK